MNLVYEEVTKMKLTFSKMSSSIAKMLASLSYVAAILGVIPQLGMSPKPGYR